MTEHHIAVYNGKEVVMDYVAPKEEFKRACMRIYDNIAAGDSGIVVTPKGQRYLVDREHKMARLMKEGIA